MKTITIAGAKGGTGKTTTAHALAYEFAAAGYGVTLVDCDPQASATQGLGHRPSEDPLAASALRLEFDHGRGGCECWLLPGGRSLATASVAQVSDRLARVPDRTDILIVDTAPAVGSIMIAAIAAADLVLVPLQAAPYPMSGLMDILKLARQVNPTSRRRAVLTLVKSRRRLATTIAEAVEEIHPAVLHATRIPDDAQCEWAAAACKPIGLFDARSRAAAAYRALADEVGIELGLVAPNPSAVAGAALPSSGHQSSRRAHPEAFHGAE